MSVMLWNPVGILLPFSSSFYTKAGLGFRVFCQSPDTTWGVGLWGAELGIVRGQDGDIPDFSGVRRNRV